MLKRFKGYFLNIALIWILIYFYRANRYYSDFLRLQTQEAMLYFAIAYTVFAFFYYMFRKSKEPSKGQIVLKTVIRLLRWKKIDPYDRTISLFVVVKVFFLPLMLNFMFDNFYSFLGQTQHWNEIFSLWAFNHLFFPFAITSIFFADTAFFAFGYLFEAGFLRNKIRSVEPTFLGWIVTLLCYPPLNGFFETYVGWYPNIYIDVTSEAWTFVMRLSILVLLAIYVSATFALGTRCSNLTNRGIVSWGPYAFVRHPAYIAKNLSWWISLIPIMSIYAFLSMAAWSFLYYLRAITEERHLGKDPDYQAYCKKVRWKFIPFVY